MPEIVAIGAVGAFVTFLIANFNLYIVHKSFSDFKIKNLNLNIGKLGWYWSMDQGAPVKMEGRDAKALTEADYQKATRGAFIFGTMMIFLSWLGLIILSIYMVSVYKIAKSRTEKKVMSSDLTKVEILDLGEIQRLLDQTTAS
ncbi:MAG: hypothetical protein B7Y39_09105 [Bdellovibrio sp. 28-41-41]|nr:MAG: hypothetical protein B7Y39_09105 [Bdellovibrio sp. 28-41-41]